MRIALGVALLALACGSSEGAGSIGAGGRNETGGAGALGGAISTGGSAAGSSSGSAGSSAGDSETGIGTGGAGGSSGTMGGMGGATGPDAAALDASVNDAHAETGSGDASIVPTLSVVTNRYDNTRSGVNLKETVLTTANVNSTRFGLLFSRQVDGQIFAQPLYLGGLMMPDGKVHDVVYTATAHNTVYAFDADSASASTPLWQKNLGPSGPTSGFSCTDMTPEVGIISTPVIDRQAGVLYIVGKGQENGVWVQRLHGLDVTTGNELPGSPVVLAASVRGTGDGTSGGMVAFNPRTALNRPGLLLQDGVVYLAFASHCDDAPYHGWILGYHYDGTRFQQTRAFNISPNGSAGGIWQGGVGLSTDGESIYFAAGNGSTNPTSSPPDLSESVVRLGLSDFAVRDYWVPTNFSALDGADSDLSSGAILLPHDLLLTGSKDGRLYVLDRTNLGKFGASADAILQTLTTPGKSSGQRGHLHGGPIYYQDATGAESIWVWPESSPLMRYAIDPSSRRLQNLVTAGIASPGHPGSIMALSANGDAPGTAVLWASMPSGSNPDGAWHMAVPGTLYAVDPGASPPRLLWSSDQNAARDAVGNCSKFNTATIANGHVYLGTFSNALRAYGLLN
jgi:hypothetical protein